MPAGSYGFRRTLYEKGWKPWDVMRLLVEYPQEARLLAIDFEETNGYQAEELEEQERKNGGTGSSSSSRQFGRASSRSGHIHSNVGTPGEFETDETIGGDDEVDWKTASQEGW